MTLRASARLQAAAAQRAPRPLVRAVLAARSRLRRLADAIVPPQAAMLDELAGIGRTVALHVAAKHNIADLVAGGGKTKHELASATGLRADLLERVLSALVMVGIFHVDDRGRYTNSRTSEVLRSDVEGSLRAMAEYFGDKLNVAAWAEMPDTLATGETVFDKAHGMGVWELFAARMDKGRLFANAMSELTSVDAPSLARGYDWSRFERICDVAGGRGTLLAEILTTFPSPRGVLFDEAHVLDVARPYLESRGVFDRVERKAGSFFQSVPAGCDAYVLKDVLHDWDDERCLTILTNVRRAMPPHGRILVCELPIDHKRPEYPAPISDLVMLVVTSGGKQRSEHELRALFERAGLAFERRVEVALPMSIFEGKLA